MTVFIVFLFIFFIQLFFYSFFFKKLKHQSSAKLTPSQGVSVIVCAKNEELALPKLLPVLSVQNYSKYEIILVNDHSTDGTKGLLETFQAAHNRSERPVKILNVIDSSLTGKKNAIQKGIEISEFDYLLFTDADCVPNSERWIEEMMKEFNEDKRIVLGYGPYRKVQNSFLNKLIRFETMMTAIQYFSYAERGIPYMGVGRNLAYHKDLFIQQNGFESHKNILSGDDDLFVSAAGNYKNTAHCLSRESFTISEAPNSFKNWVKQKRRHITTSGNYQFKHQILLALFYFSQLLFWMLPIYLFINQIQVPIVLVLILIRLSFWFVTIRHNAKVLGENDLIYESVQLEICLVCFQLYIFIANILSPSKNW